MVNKHEAPKTHMVSGIRLVLGCLASMQDPCLYAVLGVSETTPVQGVATQGCGFLTNIQSTSHGLLVWAPNLQSLYIQYNTILNHLQNRGPKFRSFKEGMGVFNNMGLSYRPPKCIMYPCSRRPPNRHPFFGNRRIRAHIRGPLAKSFGNQSSLNLLRTWQPCELQSSITLPGEPVAHNSGLL